MKRSKTIRLVLVTTVLTSCNRGMDPASGYRPDWVYATGYPYPYLTHHCDSTVLYRKTLPQSYFEGWFYAGRATSINEAPLIFKGTLVRNPKIVVRGGFGGHGFASS